MKRTLITVVALLSALTAIVMLSGVVQAAPIAYSIVNYPLSEMDQITSGQQDTLSGTIIADPSQPDGSNILSATFTLSQPGTGKSYTSSFDNTTAVSYSYLFYGLTAQVTASAITVSDGLYFPDNAWTDGAMLELDGVDTATGCPMFMLFNQCAPQFEGYVWHSWDDETQVLDFGCPMMTPYNPPGTTDIEHQVSTWVIATPVPEPSTLVLLGIGAISLLAYAWRRQKRSA